MAIEAVWILSLLAVGSHFIHANTIFVGYAPQVSFAVVGGWSALALSGQWRPESSWLDIAGRITGVVWIAVTTVLWCRYFLV
jgi:hypothetical protein